MFIYLPKVMFRLMCRKSFSECSLVIHICSFPDNAAGQPPELMEIV